jgi:hypothetical protein
MPNDGGFLSNISSEEAIAIRKNDPIAAKYLRPLVGARELVNGEERWCLWTVDVLPQDIRESNELKTRIAAVKELRQSSNREATKKLAARPAEFGENRQPKTKYIAIPRITSENRDYVPIAYLEPDVVINDKCSSISGASPAVFAVLNSVVFNVWNRAISGRTRNDTLISNTITYNNFPFPDFSEESNPGLEESAREILESRASFEGQTLAALYDPLAMPSRLRKAHENNDKAVLRAYGLKSSADDTEILARLFTMYAELSNKVE